MFDKSYVGTALARILWPAIIVVSLVVSLVACAGAPSDELEYTDRPTLCRSGETPSCIEKVGKPVRCFCADKEALRELLDPNYDI